MISIYGKMLEDGCRAAYFELADDYGDDTQASAAYYLGYTHTLNGTFMPHWYPEYPAYEAGHNDAIGDLELLDLYENTGLDR